MGDATAIDVSGGLLACWLACLGSMPNALSTVS